MILKISWGYSFFIPQSNDIALLGAGQISLGIPESAILSLLPVAKVTKSLLVGIYAVILS
ncbi:MAG TPA: hypothetical protein DC049_19475 [Spirochaetia bacterium]|nr:hypothetical protein [Spirochaetia bacterium]